MVDRQVDTSSRTGERAHAGASIFFLTVTVFSIVQAAEKTDLIDMTTDTSAQLKAIPVLARPTQM